MKLRLDCKLPLVFALLLVAGCEKRLPSAEQASSANASPPQRFGKVRRAAVAGLFYPKDADFLKRQVDHLLADAKREPIKNLRALVCPHAGYEYSAAIAASGYKQLVGRHFATVILLGPSHYAAFSGAFVSTVDAYQTPLGMTPLSTTAAALAKIEPFAANPPCQMHRPDWWPRSSRTPPPEGEDTPETWEHSLEVQLPFLQRTLGDFHVVPVVFGQVDSHQVAEKLLPFLDDQTLIVVSTDLSHYHPYDEAKTRDIRCVRAICDLRADRLTRDDACGHAAVVALIDIARRKGWQARLLDYRNSGDTAGDRSAVVGYAAIAMFEPDSAAAVPPSAAATFTASEQRLLLELARKSVTAAVRGSVAPRQDAAVPEKLRVHRACFVTLTEKDRLRGCIGSIFPQESLYRAVISRAKAAAIEDSRFPPVRTDELKDIRIEISVLTVPKSLAFTSPRDLLAKLRPGVDGVVLRVGDRVATYLPQVWEQMPDKQVFMNELAEKAGLSPDAWRQPKTTAMTYQVEAFKEDGGKEKRDGGEQKAISK
jgi:AmmeMemoRadiSam system protein A